MKKLLTLLALGMSLTAGVAHAADAAAAAPSVQQNKMKTCNVEAQGKLGDERKAFMKECLSAKPAAAPAGTTQQNKMKTCNTEAKGKSLAGDARKAFMKECLSNK